MFKLGVAGLLLGSAAIADAQSQQVGGWTIVTVTNPTVPAAYKIQAVRKVGAAEARVTRSMLRGEEYQIAREICTSGAQADPEEFAASGGRSAAARKRLTDLINDDDNYCKLTSAEKAGMLTGFEAAYAALDSAYPKGRPVIAVAPRSEAVGGWTVSDRPGPATDGLPASHILGMRKVTGPFSFVYTLDLNLDSTHPSDVSRKMVTKYKTCELEDDDSGSYISAQTRAKRFVAALNELYVAGSGSSCEMTGAELNSALAGFEDAYAVLEAWAADRLDERRALRESVEAADQGETVSDEAMKM